jgi:hypothetical protein
VQRQIRDRKIHMRMMFVPALTVCWCGRLRIHAKHSMAFVALRIATDRHSSSATLGVSVQSDLLISGLLIVTSVTAAILSRDCVKRIAGRTHAAAFVILFARGV